MGFTLLVCPLGPQKAPVLRCPHLLAVLVTYLDTETASGLGLPADQCSGTTKAEYPGTVLPGAKAVLSPRCFENRADLLKASPLSLLWKLLSGAEHQARVAFAHAEGLLAAARPACARLGLGEV